MPSDPRKRILDEIKPALPAGWGEEKHTVRSVGKLARPTVFLDYTAISHEDMPPGQVYDGYEIALVSAHEDYAKAEEQLDPIARAVIRILDASTDLSWSAASKREISGYLAWVIPVQQISHTTPQE